MWKTESWSERVAEFLDSPAKMSEKYSWPFPMGVFGTLRENQGNNPLMHVGTPYAHRYGFLSHFYAEGLSIGFNKNSCAPFEVFYYKPDEWRKMIPRVDRLEGFSPAEAKEYDYGYYRTLVWVHLLPERNERWFPGAKKANLWEHRDMSEDVRDWEAYERVPCWVYSNLNSNRALTEAVASTGIVPPHLMVKLSKPSPLIWPEVR